MPARIPRARSRRREPRPELAATPPLEIVARALSPTQTATRRRLLAAARELAIEGGYEAVNMRSVAERAGLSAPTAYQYFSSKDHILVDLLIALVGETTASIQARPSRGRSALERSVATLRRAVQRVEAEPKLYVAMTRAYISGAPEVAHARSAMETTMRAWIDLALGQSEIAERDAVVGILEAVIFSGMVGLVTGASQPVDVADALERAARTLLRESAHE